MDIALSLDDRSFLEYLQMQAEQYKPRREEVKKISSGYIHGRRPSRLLKNHCNSSCVFYLRTTLGPL